MCDCHSVVDSAFKVDVIIRRITMNSIAATGELFFLISIRFWIYMPRKERRESSSLFSQAEFRIATDDLTLRRVLRHVPERGSQLSANLTYKS